MKLQLFLSHNGVCSRRKALEIIQDGQVRVNGRRVLEPSTQVDPSKDKISVSDKLISTKRYQYILLNKPKGYVTTRSDPHAKRMVLDLLPKKFAHLSPVGRLDRDTEGLLLFTNDGDLAHMLTHPKFNVEKTYYVVVEGRLEPKTRMRLEKGLFIDGRRTARAKIQKVNARREQTKLTITIHEGRKRQIRRMFAKVKHKVLYLKRTAQGPFHLGSLKVGRWQILTPREIDKATQTINGHN